MTLDELQSLPSYQKFCEFLDKLFQFDLADLDFGIYRVLKARKAAIDKYLKEELPQCLAKYIKELEQKSRSEIETRLLEIQNKIQEKVAAVFDVEGNLTDVGKSLRNDKGEIGTLIQQYETLQHDLADYKLTEQQVSDVLLLLKDFFERYYQEGDFIAVPRFATAESYAVESYCDDRNAPKSNDFPGEPYWGEDVYFHWPTRGMHYVKSDTYLKNYSFKVKIEGPVEDTFQIRFVLDKVEHVSDNNKAKRLFFPKPEGVRLEGKTLYIPFDYRIRQNGDANNQKKIFDETIGLLLDSVLEPALREALERENLLRRRLAHFAALGSKDFFIHPHLEDFLTRELDYFTKSQALRWAEVESEQALVHRIAVLRAFRGVATDLIRFLAQLETVQARLFEKKRLVYQVDYIVPIRFVPRDLWSEVLACEEQVNYWQRDMGLEDKISEKTLEIHPTLPVYTGYFDETFKRQLLQKLPKMFVHPIENEEKSVLPTLDELTDGVLVHSENYGALRTLEARYRGQVKVIYIDPPYNSKTTEILYKNGYKHSSWLTLMEERLSISKFFETPDGNHVVAIDENEQERLGLLLSILFPEHHRICVAIIHNKKGIQGDYFSYNHDYAYFCISLNLEGVKEKPIPEEEWDYDNLRKWGKESERHTAKNCFYPILVKDGQIVGFGEVCSEDFHPEGANLVREDGTIEVYPVDSQGVERKWRYARDSVEEIKHLLKVHITNKGEVQIHKAKNTRQPKTVWDDPKYIAGDYGTRLLTEMGIFPREELYPKSLYTVLDSIYTLSDNRSIVLDYFAGSGTTGHAVIQLNREDGGRRKFVLVEMDEHFDSVLLRRIQKIMYAPEWRDGQPVEEPKLEDFTDETQLPEWVRRSPRLIKVLRLESYEDALFNLNGEPLESEQILAKLSQNPEWKKRHDPVFREQNLYLLEYFSDVLEDGNPALLRPVVEIDGKRQVLVEWPDPDRIFLKRPQPSTDRGFVEQKVDWLETTVLWLGLCPVSYEEVQQNGCTYRIMRTMRESEHVAVVLRNAEGLDAEADRCFLEEYLKGYKVIINAPSVVAFESLEDALLNAMMEGPK